MDDNRLTTPQFVKAQARFDKLWDTQKPIWEIGNVSGAEMDAGKTIPVDYCLSTIARVTKQSTEVHSALANIKRMLQEVSSDQFIYPEMSTHISLQGCTTRSATPTSFSKERIERIYAVCEPILAEFEPTTFILKGINILGSQLYVQVFPTSSYWADMRQQMVDNLVAIGESPISYPDKSPVHMNILRITNPSQQITNQYIQLIEKHDLRNVTIGEFTVSCIEYLLTDFVISEDIIQIYQEIHAKNQNT